MTFDLKRMLASKGALRRKLAQRPVAEKLALLDELRERTFSIREAAGAMHHPAVHETRAEYRSDGEGKEAKGAKRPR
jgi:hypothetical protein